jgi:hypothetical protein
MRPLGSVCHPPVYPPRSSLRNDIVVFRLFFLPFHFIYPPTMVWWISCVQTLRSGNFFYGRFFLVHFDTNRRAPISAWPDLCDL